MNTQGGTMLAATHTLRSFDGRSEREVPPKISGDSDASGRRIEDWVVFALQGRADVSETSDGLEAPDSESTPAIGSLRLLRMPTDEGRDRWKPEGTEKKPTVGLRVTDRRGITVIKPLSYALFQDDDIEAVGHEVDRLIEEGRVRIVLNLAAVHRAASRFLGVVLRASRRCVEAGGLLKICGLQPAVAEAVDVTGLMPRLVLAPDEAAALAGTWPVPPLRPLPVDSLLGLLETHDMPPEDTPEPRPDALPEGWDDDLPCQVIHDVLVIQPRTGLEDDDAIAAVRSGLERLYAQDRLPRRVVFDLNGAGCLSGRALGVLVAHALRLGRVGGTLRLCHPGAHVLSVLESVRLTGVIETYLRLDDAVVSAWE